MSKIITKKCYCDDCLQEFTEDKLKNISMKPMLSPPEAKEIKITDFDLCEKCISIRLAYSLLEALPATLCLQCEGSGYIEYYDPCGRNEYKKVPCNRHDLIEKLNVAHNKSLYRIVSHSM
jgi:hypothetical protein